MGGLEDILLNLDAEKAFDRFNRPFKFSVLYNFLALKGTCQFWEKYKKWLWMKF